MVAAGAQWLEAGPWVESEVAGGPTFTVAGGWDSHIMAMKTLACGNMPLVKLKLKAFFRKTEMTSMFRSIILQFTASRVRSWRWLVPSLHCVPHFRDETVWG